MKTSLKHINLHQNDNSVHNVEQKGQLKLMFQIAIIEFSVKYHMKLCLFKVKDQELKNSKNKNSYRRNT